MAEKGLTVEHRALSRAHMRLVWQTAQIGGELNDHQCDRKTNPGSPPAD